MKKVEEVFHYLHKIFPEVERSLQSGTPFQFLIAVMLSAQCTDERVNKVTAELFKKYSTPEDFAAISQEKLEKMIYSTGFFRNKAKNIIAMSKQLLTDYGGRLPEDARELERLAGVGRKTANVVASVVFGKAEFAVDTHIFRVLNRLELVCADTPEKTELSFIQKYPEYRNADAHVRLVLFGRHYCTARSPKCAGCELQRICGYYKNAVKNPTK